MQKILKVSLVSFLSFICLSANTISLTTDEWYPYISKNNNGFIEEIVRVTLDNIKIKYEIKYNTFDKGYKKTLLNEYDGTFPYFMSNEKLNEFYYSDSLVEVENVLFYNKKNFNNDIKNIYKYKIGYVKGYKYKNINMDKYENVVYINNEIVAFDMLHNGEIDLLPGNKLVGIHIIKKYFNDFYTNVDFLKDRNFVSTDSMHLILKKNKQNKKFMDKFNESLQKIKKNGKYKIILLNNRSLINASLASVVKLVNNIEAFPMVVATDTINSKKKYMIPRGTKAIVVEWSKHFKEKGNIKVYDEMFKKTKVKIVNGPLKGRILYVENMYIEIN